MVRGRLAVLRRRSDGEGRVRAYAKFMETVSFFATIPVLPFDSSCERIYRELREQGIRLGTRDLRIAATALANGVTLITRNRRDFALVPGLKLEDWTVRLGLIVGLGRGFPTRRGNARQGSAPSGGT